MQPRSLRPRLLVPFVCTLLGCSAAPADPGATGGESTGAGSSSTGDRAPTIAELADCDEVDIQTIPFQGPAFDPETGALLEPLPIPHIVATTSGWHGPDLEQAKLLNEQTKPVVMDVFGHEGLLGASFGYSAACSNARTLSLWRDEASLMKFVFGAAHSNGIKNGLQYAIGWENTHWTETTRDQPPTWEQARARLDARRQ